MLRKRTFLSLNLKRTAQHQLQLLIRDLEASRQSVLNILSLLELFFPLHDMSTFEFNV